MSNTRKTSLKKNRKCMFGDCNRPAINSPVMQKNGILREMSENNHVVVTRLPNIFENTGDIFDLKPIGINQAYSFYGYCQKHDTNIFTPIESISSLDFNNINTQALFSYRGLCQEIRRKEIVIEILNNTIEHFPQHQISLINAHLDGLNRGVLNLNFYKNEFENCILKNNFDKFYFTTIKIPRINICISVPLNIEVFIIPENPDYDIWKKSRKFPIKTSFINVFPKGTSSYVICGYHKNFPCKWTDNFISKICTSNKEGIFKELSDLITLRLEFWAMSPKLFNKIDKDTLNAYKAIFKENALNHSPSLKTDINLFENL